MKIEGAMAVMQPLQVFLITSCPSRNNRSAVLEPMNPAPPVIIARIEISFVPSLLI